MIKEQELIVVEELNQLIDKSRDLREEEFYTIFTIHEVQNIETVLSMLKENSAEIEKKNTELAEKNAEIERLNRQKDLMAEEIEKGDIEFTEYCNFKIVCDRNCKECIKQYFEREVNSSEQN